MPLAPKGLDSIGAAAWSHPPRDDCIQPEKLPEAERLLGQNRAFTLDGGELLLGHVGELLVVWMWLDQQGYAAALRRFWRRLSANATWTASAAWDSRDNAGQPRAARLGRPGARRRSVASLLQAVHRPTLTGLGERVHLASRAVNVAVHVQDVVNVLVYEALSEVILVGHSYAGMVITGVAERTPDRTRHLVYLDAFVPEDGESARDIMGRVLGPGALTALDEDVRRNGDGWRLARPPADSDGTPNPRATDQPYSTFTQPIEVRNPGAVPIPRTYIQCFERTPAWPFGPVLAYCAERARARGARYYELPTGHAVWRTAPRALADVLLSLND